MIDLKEYIANLRRDLSRCFFIYLQNGKRFFKDRFIPSPIANMKMAVNGKATFCRLQPLSQRGLFRYSCLSVRQFRDHNLL